MAHSNVAIRHTTSPCYSLAQEVAEVPYKDGGDAFKRCIIRGFFNRNTLGRLPYDGSVVRNFGRSAILLALAVGSCAPATNKAAKEYEARPACAGMVDAKLWTDCMQQFKEIRPQHPPTALQFGDWRT